MLEGAMHQFVDLWCNHGASITTTRVGLAYDVCGAFVLTLSAAFLSKRKVADAQLFWRAKANTRTLYQTQYDSIVGMALLLIGFCLQFVGTVQRAPKGIGQYFAFALCLGLLAYFLMRRRYVRLRMERLAAKEET